MFQIQNMTSDPKQRQSLVLPDGSIIQLAICFRPLQIGWFVTSITYGEFVLNGLRICNSPNMLHQFRNKIPFGLACFSVGKREPSQSEDFSSDNSKLFIITAQEATAFSEFLNGQV